MDTIVLVRVVPIFAPITMGIASLRSMALAATAATNIEVVVELLCSNAVERRPINRPMNGFSIAPKIIDDASPDIDRIDKPIMLIVSRKINTADDIASVLYNPECWVEFKSCARTNSLLTLI